MTLNFKNALLLLLFSPTALNAKDNCFLLRKHHDSGKTNAAAGYNRDSATAVRVHDFFWNEKTVSVVQNGKRTSIPKNDLLGYRDNTGAFYRFYNNDKCLLTDTNGICVYVKYELVPAGKSFEKKPVWFFSQTLNTPLHRLSAANLQAIGMQPSAIDSLLKKCGADNNATFRFSLQPSATKTIAQPHTK
jgi:hypothetical protein